MIPKIKNYKILWLLELKKQNKIFELVTLNGKA